MNKFRKYNQFDLCQILLTLASKLDDKRLKAQHKNIERLFKQAQFVYNNGLYRA